MNSQKYTNTFQVRTKDTQVSFSPSTDKNRPAKAGRFLFSVLGAGLEPATLRSSGECSKPTELPKQMRN